METVAMKTNTKAVFDYIKANNTKDMTAADVAAALGVERKSVDGSFTSFQKKGWGERILAAETTPDGKAIKYLHLTDAGMAIEAVEA